jgi:hypothetical protein
MSLDTSDGAGLRPTAQAGFLTQLRGANDAQFSRLHCTWPVVFAAIEPANKQLAINGNIKSP